MTSREASQGNITSLGLQQRLEAQAGFQGNHRVALAMDQQNWGTNPLQRVMAMGIPTASHYPRQGLINGSFQDHGSPLGKAQQSGSGPWVLLLQADQVMVDCGQGTGHTRPALLLCLLGQRIPLSPAMHRG